jgi:phospholipase/carboxylesterase
LAETSLTYEDLALMGFSQGGMLSLHLAAKLAHKPKGVVSFSGFINNPSLQSNGEPKTTKILITHGKQDSVVPFKALAAAEDALQLLGYTCDTLSVDGLDHGIDHKCINKAVGFLKALWQ